MSDEILHNDVYNRFQSMTYLIFGFKSGFWSLKKGGNKGGNKAKLDAKHLLQTRQT